MQILDYLVRSWDAGANAESRETKKVACGVPVVGHDRIEE